MGEQRPAHHAGGDDVGSRHIDTAVEATKLGATDFLEKPVALAKLIDTVNKAIKRGVTPPGAHPAWIFPRSAAARRSSS